MRVDKVVELPAAKATKHAKFYVKVGYGPNPFEFTLRTQEKVGCWPNRRVDDSVSGRENMILIPVPQLRNSVAVVVGWVLGSGEV